MLQVGCPGPFSQILICKIGLQNETQTLGEAWMLHSGLGSQILWAALGLGGPSLCRGCKTHQLLEAIGEEGR